MECQSLLGLNKPYLDIEIIIDYTVRLKLPCVTTLTQEGRFTKGLIGYHWRFNLGKFLADVNNNIVFNG